MAYSIESLAAEAGVPTQQDEFSIESLANEAGVLSSIQTTPLTNLTTAATAESPADARVGLLEGAGIVGQQFAYGFQDDLPRMLGDAMKYVSEPGGYFYDQGKKITDWVDEQEKNNPDLLKKYEFSKNPVLHVLAGGARMIPQSLGPPLLLAGAAALLPETAIAALGGAAVVGVGAALAGAVPAGLSQGQQTYDKLLAAGVDDQTARESSRLSGLIEWGGESVENMLGVVKWGAKLAGVGIKTTKLGGKDAVEYLAKLAEPTTWNTVAGKTIADVAKTMAWETGTEVGQQVGETAVENRAIVAAGGQPESLVEAAKSVVGPTIGMTLIMTPLGIHANTREINRQNTIKRALIDPTVHPEYRSAAALSIAKDLYQLNPEAGGNFAINSTTAITLGQPMPLNEEAVEDPAKFHEQVFARYQSRAQTVSDTMANLAQTGSKKTESPAAQPVAPTAEKPAESTPAEPVPEKPPTERIAETFNLPTTDGIVISRGMVFSPKLPKGKMDALKAKVESLPGWRWENETVNIGGKDVEYSVTIRPPSSFFEETAQEEKSAPAQAAGQPVARQTTPIPILTPPPVATPEAKAQALGQPLGRFQHARNSLTGEQTGRQTEIHALTEPLFQWFLHPFLGNAAQTLDEYRQKFPGNDHIALTRTAPNAEWQASGVGSQAVLSGTLTKTQAARQVPTFDSPEAAKQALTRTPMLFQGEPNAVRITGKLADLETKFTGIDPNTTPAVWQTSEGTFVAAPKVEKRPVAPGESVYLGRLSDKTAAGKIERLFAWDGTKWTWQGVKGKTFTRDELRQKATLFAAANAQAIVRIKPKEEPKPKTMLQPVRSPAERLTREQMQTKIDEIKAGLRFKEGEQVSYTTTLRHGAQEHKGTIAGIDVMPDLRTVNIWIAGVAKPITEDMVKHISRESLNERKAEEQTAQVVDTKVFPGNKPEPKIQAPAPRKPATLKPLTKTELGQTREPPAAKESMATPVPVEPAQPILPPPAPTEEQAPIGAGPRTAVTDEAGAGASLSIEQRVEDNLGLAYSIADRYAVPGMTRDEIRAEAAAALTKAANLFDPARGDFAAFVGATVRNHLNEVYNSELWEATHAGISLNEQIGNEAESESRLTRVPDNAALPTDQQALIADIRTDLNKAISELPEHEQIVVEGILSGKTQDAIAEELGLSPAAISKRKVSLLKNLRTKLEDMGYDRADILDAFRSPGDVADQIEMAKANRKAWPAKFPDAVINTTLPFIQKNHAADFDAAKRGDTRAAARLVRAVIKPEKVRELGERFPNAILVAVHEEETTGRNKLPILYAKAIGKLAGLNVDTEIVQIAKVHHRGTNAIDRILRRAEFDGPVIAGQEYIIVDDHITQGGIVSELRHYIVNNGGKVVAVTGLTASTRSTTIAIQKETIAGLERKFGRESLEPIIRESNIAGRLEALTESEGRYILSFGSINTIRNRIAEGRQTPSLSVSGRTLEGPAPSAAKAETLIRNWISKRANVPETVVIQSVEDVGDYGLSGQTLRMLRENQPRGFYDGASNRIFVVADQLQTPEEAIEVVLHEAIGHYGIESVLGPRFHTDMLALSREIPEANLREIANLYQDTLPDQNLADPLSSNRNRVYATREYVAKQAEVEPTLWQKFIEIVRRTMSKILPVSYVNRLFKEGKIEQLIRTSREFVEKSRTAPASITSTVLMSKVKWGTDTQGYRRANPATTPEAMAFFRSVESQYEPSYVPNAITRQVAADELKARGATTVITEIASGKIGTQAKDVALFREATATPEMTSLITGTDQQKDIAIAAGFTYHEQLTRTARALQIARNDLETPEQRRAAIIQMLTTPPDDVRSRFAGMNPTERRRAIEEQRVRMSKAIEALKRLGITDLNAIAPEKLMDNQGFMEIVNEIGASMSGKMDRIYEYWRNAILSGIQTNLTNLGGNWGFGTWELFAQRPAEALVNMIAHAPGAPTLESIKAAYRLIGPSITRANAAFLKAFVTEVAESGKIDTVGSVAISGKMGRIIRYPQRALLAVDEWFKTVYVSSLAADYATRQADRANLVGRDRDEFIKWAAGTQDTLAHQQAYDEALRLLWQNKPGEIGSKLISLRNAKGVTGWIFKFIFPFVTTPTNIIKTGILKSPFGVLRMGFEGAKEALGHDGRYANHPDLLLRDTVEQLFAWTLTGLLYAATTPGDPNDPEDKDKYPWLTGSLSGSTAEKRFLSKNMPAQSIRIGDKWYSYARIEPLATALTLTIDALNTFRSAAHGKPLGKDDAAKLIALIRDKTYLQGLGDLIRGLEDPEQWVDLAQNFSSSWVPNLLKQAARATDPYVRDYRVRSRGTTWLGESLLLRGAQEALPVAGIQPLPRFDHWGNPISKDAGMSLLGQPLSDIAWRMLMPIRAQTATNFGNLDRMIWNWNRAQTEPDAEWWPGTPRPEIKLRGKDYQLTDDQYRQYLEMRGKLAQRMAERQHWNFDEPTPSDIKRIQKVFEHAGQLSKRVIIRELLNPQVTASQAS